MNSPRGWAPAIAVVALAFFLGVQLADYVLANPQPKVCPALPNTTCPDCCYRLIEGQEVWVKVSVTPNQYMVCVTGESSCTDGSLGIYCFGNAYTNPDCTGTKITESFCPVVGCDKAVK
jgi:hypothetical protein